MRDRALNTVFVYHTFGHRFAIVMFALVLLVLSFSTGFATKSKTCGPYPYATLEHGNVTRSGFMKYTFSCDKGYYLLLRRSTVKCHRGQWIPFEKPKCYWREGQCDDPPVVAHSKAHGEDWYVDAHVKYICDNGYILLGNSELTCTRSGHWKGIPPTCMDESEPIEIVAERLRNGFVTNLAIYSEDTPEGWCDGRDCMNFGLELYILIDRSSSVDPVRLEDAKKFVKFLLHRFAVRNGVDNRRGTRASVIAFGTELQRVFTVANKSISNPTLAGIAVDSIQPYGGGTNLEVALILPILDLDAGTLRPEAKRAIFLMTDGEPNIANPEITPQDIASVLKNDYDFEIFTMGIGKDINIHLLNDLASQPPLSHVFLLEDFAKLNDIMAVLPKPKPPPISKDQCGYNAKREKHPWHAAIYIGGTPFKVCGGVLICNEWVLTAASCLQHGQDHINMKDVFVVLGEESLIKEDKDQTNFYVTEIRINSQFDPEQQIKNDLALLKIYLPEYENPKYRPACLPLTDRAVPMHLNLGVNASIAGWGMTSASPIALARADDLHLFKMLTTPVALSMENECPIQRHGLQLLCAGQGSSACYGLLGSPLMAVDSSTGFQHVLGILAHRVKCAEGQNQYVELTKHVQWINHETRNCHLRHWDLAK